MIRRGQIQLRGRLRRWVRRARTRRRVGAAVMDQMPIVLGNGIPKNGSTLLFNILRRLPMIGPFVDTGLNAIKPNFKGRPTPPKWIHNELTMLRPGDVRVGYLHATPDNIALICRPGWAPFFIHRDPRDSLVSGIFYAMEIHTDHIMHEYYQGQEDMETRLSTAIAGIPDGKFRFANIRTIYERYIGWLDQPEVCVIRFEDLISEPHDQLRRMIDHLLTHGFQPTIPTDEALETLLQGMDPQQSDTFRKGKAGGWQKHFTADNKIAFKEISDDLLIRLGYEKNMDW